MCNTDFINSLKLVRRDFDQQVYSDMKSCQKGSASTEVMAAKYLPYFDEISRSRAIQNRCFSCLGVIDQVVLSSPLGKIETPNAKKRHRRVQQTNPVNSINNSTTPKSMSNNNGGDDDGDENVFIVVSLDKQWYFEAQSNEERDEWVSSYMY